MSDWDPVSIRDSTGAPVDVGAREIDGVFHPTALGLSSRIEEASGVTFSGTFVDIALDGSENFVAVDLGTSNPPFDGAGIELGLQFVSGGAFYPAEPLPQTPNGYRTGFKRGRSDPRQQGRYTYGYGGDGGSLAGHRLVLVPTRGARTLRIRTTSGSLTGCAWARLAIFPPVVETVSKAAVAVVDAYPPSLPYTGTYAVGDVVGGTIYAKSRNVDPSEMLDGALRLAGVAVEDFDGNLGQFDLVIGPYGDFSYTNDNDPMVLGYAGGLFAWLEFRDSPAAGQFHTRTYGPSHTGGFASGLDLLIPYMGTAAGGGVGLCACNLVARDALTGTGEIYVAFYFTGA